MILTVHTIAAASISNQFKNKYIGWSMALLSHFILDAIPHSEYSIMNPLFGLFFFLDLFTGFVLIIIFTRNKNNLLKNLIAGIIGICPDGFTLLYIIFANYDLFQIGILNKITNGLTIFYKQFHNLIHAPKTHNLFLGIITQLIISIISLIFLKNPVKNEV